MSPGPHITPLWVRQMLEQQRKTWPEAVARHDDAANAIVRKITLGDFSCTLIFIPAREVSSGAKVDAAAVAKRPCFLCEANRPTQQLSHAISDGYQLLINPFPIFPGHLTITSTGHRRQSLQKIESDIVSTIESMFEMAKMMPGHTLFYNGALCGASAPDHLHFQAVATILLPIANVAERERFPYETISICANTARQMEDKIDTVFMQLLNRPENKGLDEPRVNLFMTYLSDSQTVECIIVPRRAHRPDFYGREDGQMLISPGAIDVAGMMVCCRQHDFEHINAQLLKEILTQTTYYTTL